MIVYKGMLTVLQLEHFYPGLADPRYASALAVVHSRFSTNTFPSWPLAHPYRVSAHNGEINTIQGLELLHLCGRSLPHAVLMMIPEPWENNAADCVHPRRNDRTEGILPAIESALCW